MSISGSGFGRRVRRECRTVLRGGLRVVLVALMLLTVGFREAEAFFPWKTELSPPNDWQFVVSDFDRDGKDDVVGYHPDNGSIWFGRNTRNDTPPGSEFAFARWRTMPGSDPRGWRLVAAGYSSRSGWTNLVFYSPRTGALRVGVVMRSPLRDGSFHVGINRFRNMGRVPGSNPEGWQFIAAAFDNDGRMDVLGYDPSNGSLNLGTNTAASFAFDSAPWAVVTPHSDWTFGVGDFNGDGKLDVLGHHPSDGSLHVGINSGRGFTFRELEVGLGRHARFVAGNFSTPSRSGIIRYDTDTGNLDRGENALDADARGSFMYSGPWATVPANHRRDWQLLAGNFFGDSKTDVMLYDPHTGTLWVGSDQQPFEGYSWPLSVAPGGEIDFYISGAGSAGARFSRFKGDPDALRRITSEDMGRAGFLPTVQFTKEHPWRDGAEWNKSFTFQVPGGWPSGIYSASLTSLSPSISHPHITFVVRPAPGTHSDVAVLANVNTWLAYNRWGGKGKYQGKTPVSFMRPKPSTSLIADNPEDIMPRREDLPSPIVHRSDPQHLTRGELWILGWLEHNGFRPDVYTDIDFHNGEVHRRGYKVLVLSTHPEYWSAQMYGNLEQFLEGGGSLLYLGGNGIYENAEYLDDQKRMEFFGGITDGSAKDRRARALFRTVNRLRPERNVLGVATANCGVDPAPFRVERSKGNHDLFAGIDWQDDYEFGAEGLNTGWKCNGAASCWEVDTIAGAGSIPPVRECATSRRGVRVNAGTPPANLEVLARARNAADKGADLVFYPHPNSGFVLSVGSITFGGTLWKDERSHTLIKNFMAKAGVR